MVSAEKNPENSRSHRATGPADQPINPTRNRKDSPRRRAQMRLRQQELAEAGLAVEKKEYETSDTAKSASKATSNQDSGSLLQQWLASAGLENLESLDELARAEQAEREAKRRRLQAEEAARKEAERQEAAKREEERKAAAKRAETLENPIFPPTRETPILKEEKLDSSEPAAETKLNTGGTLKRRRRDLRGQTSPEEQPRPAYEAVYTPEESESYLETRSIPTEGIVPGSKRKRSRTRETRVKEKKSMAFPIIGTVFGIIIVVALVIGTFWWSVPTNNVGESATSEPTIEVKGRVGTEPVVTLSAPLPLQSTKVAVLVKGQGRPLVESQLAVFRLTVFSGQDGKRLSPSSDAGIISGYLAPNMLTPELYETVKGLPEGSRVLLKHPVEADGEQVMEIGVVDILPSTAQGEPKNIPEGFGVKIIEDGESFRLETNGDDTKTSRSAVIMQGDGVAVGPQSRVLLRYIEVPFKTPEQATAKNWSEALPVKVDLSKAQPGVRSGLVDKKVGSRVLLVVAPQEGAGTETQVMLADILAAW